jgi:hypothetical protein
MENIRKKMIFQNSPTPDIMYAAQMPEVFDNNLINPIIEWDSFFKEKLEYLNIGGSPPPPRIFDIYTAQMPEVFDHPMRVIKYNLINQKIEWDSFFKEKLEYLNIGGSPPPPRIFEPNGSFPSLEVLPVIEYFQRTLLLNDEIIIARPLKELYSHIIHLKIPTLELFLRAIKTLVLSLFKWHLCDHCLVKVEDQIIHSISGEILRTNINEFRTERPFMLENAFYLVPNENVRKINEGFIQGNIVPDAIQDYFERCYEINITGRSEGNKIGDLFSSQYFEIKNYEII